MVLNPPPSCVFLWVLKRGRGPKLETTPRRPSISNGWKCCGIFVQWNTKPQQEEMNPHATPITMNCTDIKSCKRRKTWKKMQEWFHLYKDQNQYDPAIPLLSTYAKETESLSWRGICTPVSLAGLFTRVKTWEWTKCPLTDAWITKMWALQTSEWYSAIKKKEILPSASTRRKLRGMTPSEVSQTERQICMILLICGM